MATYSNKEKAAILLIALGKEYAAEIYKYLDDEEIEQLTLAITAVRRVDPEDKEEILSEFYEICMAQQFMAEGGIEYAREILDKAVGTERAIELISKLSSSLQVRPFDFVRRVDPAQLINFLQNEYPQTIALILSYLDPKQAAQVLSSLPLQKQPEVIERIATMGAAMPEYIKEAERILERKVSSLGFSSQTSVGGIDTIVEILNSVDRGTEKSILESLDMSNADLAEDIRNKLFVFEDLAKLSNTIIQRILKEVDNHDLAIALKGSNQDVTDTIFKNVSSRLKELIQEDMEFIGPVRVREVEEAQQKIVNIIRRLEDAGEITTSRGSDDLLVM